VQKGKLTINWTALGVIAGVVILVAIVSPIGALCLALLIAIVLIVNNSGTGRWVPGGIGDDTRAARGPRYKGPPDY
jgi:hypothetical protein